MEKESWTVPRAASASLPHPQSSRSESALDKRDNLKIRSGKGASFSRTEI